VARFQRTGDGRAFEEVVERCLAPALAVARRKLGSAWLAEDAVQEAFLRVVRRREAYTPHRPFSSWFFAILRNVCIDMLRSQARQARLIQAAAERLLPAGPVAEADPTARDMLAALPAGERDVLALRIVDGLSFREVAAALGITAEAAKKRSQRGLRRLRHRRRVAESLEITPEAPAAPDRAAQSVMA